MMRLPGHGKALGGLAVFLALSSARCGTDGPNRFGIAGQVTLVAPPDGGAEVTVLANVSRPLLDGGSENVLDAGVALNGVPLGPGDPLVLSQGQTVLQWSRPSFPGAAPLQRQTLSVIGSNPPATVSFVCPVAVSFTAPMQNATVERSVPLLLTWTPGGSPAFSEVLLFQAMLNGALVDFGFTVVPPGTTSQGFTLTPGTPAGVEVLFTLDVSGDAPDTTSKCASGPALRVFFP
jgi:hypothetical protein